MEKNDLDREIKNLFSDENKFSSIISVFFRIIVLFFIVCYKKLFSKRNKEFAWKVFLSINKVMENSFLIIMYPISKIITLSSLYFCKFIIISVKAFAKAYNYVFSQKNKKKYIFYRDKLNNRLLKLDLILDQKLRLFRAAMIKNFKSTKNYLGSEDFKTQRKKRLKLIRMQIKSFYYNLFPRSRRAKIALFFQTFFNKIKRLVPKKYLKLPYISMTLMFLLFGVITSGLIISYLSLPDIKAVKYYHPKQTTEIYDVNNKVLVKLHNEENRIVIKTEELPDHVKNAVIAMEDERFYQHHGFDPKAIIRASLSYILPSNNMVQGGASTITQQVARNIYLSRERSLSRKIREILMAVKLESNFSKDKILDVYLNEIYWGHNAYGIEAASKSYFGKSAKDLSLAEAAMLGGMLSSPENYSPYKSMKNAKWRQSLTLANMEKNAYISKTDVEIAKKTAINLNNTFQNKKYKMEAPYFSSYVISLLRKKYGEDVIKNGGLRVYTTIDLREQKIAEKFLEQGIKSLKNRKVGQGSLLSVEPNTGYIKAMVGGVDFEKSQFNRATQALRQPGSAFKPLIYLAAINKKILTPNTYIKDEKISYKQYGGVWSPQNYSDKYRGDITVKDALKYSVNTVAVKVLEKVGLAESIAVARKLGIKSNLQANLTLALGSSEISQMELISAYSVFAAKGKKVSEITPIVRIEDIRGNIIEDNRKIIRNQVVPVSSIALLDSALKEVVSPGGTGHAADIPYLNVSGKTGTSSDNKDAWFVGYTPELVTLVWAGNDDNSSMDSSVTGGSACAPIWKKFTEEVMKNKPVTIVRAANLKNN